MHSSFVPVITVNHHCATKRLAAHSNQQCCTMVTLVLCCWCWCSGTSCCSTATKTTRSWNSSWTTLLTSPSTHGREHWPDADPWNFQGQSSVLRTTQSGSSGFKACDTNLRVGSMSLHQEHHLPSISHTYLRCLWLFVTGRNVPLAVRSTSDFLDNPKHTMRSLNHLFTCLTLWSCLRSQPEDRNSLQVLTCHSQLCVLTIITSCDRTLLDVSCLI